MGYGDSGTSGGGGDISKRSDYSSSSSSGRYHTPSPSIKRRNSTGTLFVTHTMSQQDNKSTIHCVCVVIRAHMKDAVEQRIVPSDEYNVFQDSLSTLRNLHYVRCIYSISCKT